MFLSKKIAKVQKVREAQKLPEPDQETVHKAFQGKKRLQKLRFRQLPRQPKHINNEPVSCLHGDWPFTVKNNQLFTELSLFNEYKTFQNISIEEDENQKYVVIKPSLRKDNDLSTMHEVMDLFSEPELKQTFKDFYQTYDKVMKRQSRKKVKSDTRKKFYTKVDEKTAAKTEELFEENPVFQLKFRMKSHHSLVHELVFSQKFIEELGYTVEDFVTFVLQEGLPQIMPFDNPCSNLLMDTIVDKYYGVDEDGLELPNLTSTLFMNGGLAKDIQYKINFLKNYEMNSFGMDVFFSITAKGEPYIKNFVFPDPPINETYIQTINEREQEAAYFLKEYYSEEMAALESEEESPIVAKEVGGKFEEDDSPRAIKLEETDHTDEEQIKSEEDF